MLLHADIECVILWYLVLTENNNLLFGQNVLIKQKERHILDLEINYFSTNETQQ